jgi:hypothetical protein
MRFVLEDLGITAGQEAMFQKVTLPGNNVLLVSAGVGGTDGEEAVV